MVTSPYSIKAIGLHHQTRTLGLRVSFTSVTPFLILPGISHYPTRHPIQARNTPKYNWYFSTPLHLLFYRPFHHLHDVISSRFGVANVGIACNLPSYHLLSFLSSSFNILWAHPRQGGCCIPSIFRWCWPCGALKSKFVKWSDKRMAHTFWVVKTLSVRHVYCFAGRCMQIPTLGKVGIFIGILNHLLNDRKF